MMLFSLAVALVGVLPTAFAASSSSRVARPSEFKPPRVFKNENLVHIISLEKNYVKEQINVIIENVDSQPQDEYFLPFTPDQMARIGGFEVKDRKDAHVGPFTAEVVEFDSMR